MSACTSTCAAGSLCAARRSSGRMDTKERRARTEGIVSELRRCLEQGPDFIDRRMSHCPG